MPSLLSVVVCTCRRPDMLRAVLQDLAGCEGASSASFECLVVDNAPTPEIEALVCGLQSSLPVRYVEEPAPGLSRARNRGVAESNGDVVWFIDDDVRLEPGWLAAVLAAVHDWPQASCFSGRILPDWCGAVPPAWVNLHANGPESHAGTYLFRDLGSETRPLRTEADGLVMGANMGFRRTAFDRVGGFRADLDPLPGAHRLGGDTEFALRLRAAGEEAVYVGAALVRHVTPPRRLTVRYALKWSYYHGRSSQAMKSIRHVRANRYDPGYRLAETVRGALHLVLAAGRALVLSALPGQRRRVGSWMRAFYRAGRLAACFDSRPDPALDRPEVLAGSGEAGPQPETGKTDDV